MIANLLSATDAEIERLLASPGEVTRFLFGSETRAAADRISLDRSWHAIHFALNGSRLGGQPPLNFLVDEGRAVGAVDVGFGPARVLTSAEVRALAEQLGAIPPDHLRQRVDLPQLDREAIYPGNWQRNGRDVDYIVDHYAALHALVTRLAQAGLGLVLYIN